MAVSNGKINITINKDRKTEFSQQNINQPEIESKQPDKPSQTAQIITGALIQSGKQAINQGINTYASLSGDIETARGFNTAIGVSADILTMMASPIGVIAVGTKYALNAINSFVATKNANRVIDYNNSQLGIISKKGSRYY